MMTTTTMMSLQNVTTPASVVFPTPTQVQWQEEEEFPPFMTMEQHYSTCAVGSTSHIIQNCWQVKGPRPLVNASSWKSLQEAYHQLILGSSSSSSSWGYDDTNGMRIPYEIKHSVTKGRGIYATSKIQKGDIVWKPTNHVAFPTKYHFRNFLSTLSYDLACDVLLWSYVERKDNHFANHNNNNNRTTPEDHHPCRSSSNRVATPDTNSASTAAWTNATLTINTTTTNATTSRNNHTTTTTTNDDECYHVVVELDDGSFMNDITRNIDGQPDEVATVGLCNEELHALNNCYDVEGLEGYDTHYALRDIEPGQEIMVDYHTFDHEQALEWFDTMVDAAWWDPSTAANSTNTNTILPNNSTTMTTTNTTTSVERTSHTTTTTTTSMTNKNRTTPNTTRIDKEEEERPQGILPQTALSFLILAALPRIKN